MKSRYIDLHQWFLKLSSSSFQLNATLRHHISNSENEDLEFVYIFLQSLYVDVVISESDEDRAYEVYIKAKLRMSNGEFYLKKLASNSKDLIMRS